MPSAKKKQHKKIKHEKYLSSISKHKSKVQVQIKLQFLKSICSKKSISPNKVKAKFNKFQKSKLQKSSWVSFVCVCVYLLITDISI